MSPAERAQELMMGLGAEALSGYLKQAWDVEVCGSWVSTAFSPLEVDQVTEKIEVCGIKRPVLAIVNHGWNMHHYRSEVRMMNWIPEMKKSPPYNTPERHILSAFGIVELENFEYLGDRVLVRKPIPVTAMNLGGLGNEWIFEGYNRRNRDSFNRLRETLWAIAMLPQSVVEKALNERHFLLVNDMIGGVEENGEGQITAMAAITKGSDRVLVEDFSGRAIKDYKEGSLEKETPVVVLRHH